MFNSNNGGYSLADVASVVGNDNNGLGNFGGGWWAILILIALFGWGGFGNFGNWGGNSGVVPTLNTDYLSSSIRDLQSGVNNSFMTLNNELLNGFCDNRTAFAQNTASIMDAVTNGFNTQNLANLQNSNAIQRDIYAGTVGAMQNTQAIQSTLAQMASDNRADTAQIAYNQATNTCAINTNASNNTRDIVDAINSGNQMLANMLNQNKVEAMQNRINELQAEVQSKNLAASQAAQNSYLIEQLRPSPIPAYRVANPYGGCNCGNMTTYGNMMANV